MNIWAHRGCSYKYPENTLSAFQAACEYQITGIELDVQLTCDGKMVVIHDERVDRTTDGSGEVQNMTLEEIKKLRIIPNEESGLTYETVPTLREVFEILEHECKERGLLINIELKNSVVRYEGMEQQVLELVKEFGLESYIIYSSFNTESVKLMKELDPNAKTGILAPEVSQCLTFAETMPVDALHPYVKQIDVANLADKTVLPVRAWNVMQYEPFFPEKRECEVQDLEKLKALGITDIFTNAPENYVRMWCETKKEIIFDVVGQINPETGFVEKIQNNCVATYHLYKATAGSILYEKQCEYEYQLYVYSLDTQKHWIYSYCYQEEENWATYSPQLSVLYWMQGDYKFKEDCYFRICIRKIDGTQIDINAIKDDIFSLDKISEEKYKWLNCFQRESNATVDTVRKLKTQETYTMLVLTDSHYVVNGTWQDTAYNLKKTAEQIYPDAIIHLGDITDGMTPETITKEYSAKVLDDLKSLKIPVYMCLGNHDSNYFKNNPEEMTVEECSRWYLNNKEPYYYVDVPQHQLRMFFLFSFNQHEEIRYGFPMEEIQWLKESLWKTPDGYHILVFSHVPPLPQIHFWSDEIRNGEELLSVLEEYHKVQGKCVLAYIHGHNHADQIYTEREFPIISIGCNKLEDFKDKKPDGSITYDREWQKVTQDLWDVLVVNFEEKRMDFVRFGAGEDRHICWS